MKQRRFVTLMGASLLMAGTAFAQQEQTPPPLDAAVSKTAEVAKEAVQEAADIVKQAAANQPQALDAPAQAPAAPAQSPGMGGMSMSEYLANRKKGMEHKFTKALQYYLEFNPQGTPEDFEKMRPYLKPFTDAEVMADMFTDPRKMAAWMDAITEPDVIYLMMKCSQEPVMWDTWLRGLTDYEKLTRAMFRFFDPTTYMNWAVGLFDPQLYATLFRLLDPNKYARWAYASGNLKFYEPLIQWVYPSWWDERAQWLLDPQTFQPVLDLFAIPQPQPMG